MYGILKLQDMITEDPEGGWRERYGAEGTEEYRGEGSEDIA